ncbi:MULTISPECIES: hypothetical protein [Pseudoalteromonas]|uniref:Uncharacterized protein n=1 Tax=Pseudoalteromonas arctica TaxID=394751 RepID=A0AAP7CIW0_9GAMM|nr:MULTISPECIES: hypothetical protein [Pseudoalteromonas]NMP02059.1 hypothetical protein [Pseudoalteromonas arctica]PKG66137.1 hypothetical protein CXF75_05525 [Pseudoalteromonas arctica]PKG72116.1 hypothetical protein CXF64_01820 [Pseudoalteromonas sp. GutCa3]
MNKGNAWPWVISLCIHGVLLYLLLSHKLLSQKIKVEVPQTKKDTVINAYVMVNLSTQPKLSTVNTTTNAPIAEPAKLEVKKVPESISTNKTPTTQTQVTKAPKQRDEKPKTTTVTKLTITNKPQPPAHTINTNTQTFKKLNPYAPIYGAPINNLTHKKMVTFGEADNSDSTDDAIAATPTIKSPVKSQKSEVISQNTIGTRRLEKFNGKCYLIDTSTVFGSNGMPQGSAQTCPGEQTDDEILFNKIMDKWARKNN